MKGPSEKYLCSLEIELGSPSLSHLPTAPQGEGAFLGVNEKNSFKYLFSARLHLREPMVRTSSAYQPSTCMFLGPERKGIPSHPTVPPHNPSPHPTPPLPEGLSSDSRGGVGTSLATSSWQSFHRLAGVPMSLPPCPPWPLSFLFSLLYPATARTVLRLL